MWAKTDRELRTRLGGVRGQGRGAQGEGGRLLTCYLGGSSGVSRTESSSHRGACIFFYWPSLS